MKSEALFLTRNGNAEQAFEMQPFEVGDPGRQEVVIEVEAFGLNYADVMARKGLYRDAPPMPCVIGYEVVGKVVSTGKDADQSLEGKRVLAFCRFGGYARHVITNDYAVVPVEDQDAAELLSLCTQAVTAYYMAEYLCPVHATDTVLVHAAAGGVGTILVQLAKMRGAKVVAKVGKQEKEALVRELGADEVVNYNQSDYAEQIKKLLAGRKIDVSFNPVGGSTYKKDMALLGAGGRMVLFGGSELSNGKWGFLSQLNFVRKMGLVIPVALMMQSKNILGVNMLRIADDKPEVMAECLKGVVGLYRSDKLQPQVGGRYSADELHIAHNALEQGGTTGKLAVYWDLTNG